MNRYAQSQGTSALPCYHVFSDYGVVDGFRGEIVPIIPPVPAVTTSKYYSNFQPYSYNATKANGIDIYKQYPERNDERCSGYKHLTNTYKPLSSIYRL
jgi:hypothetical protein